MIKSTFEVNDTVQIIDTGKIYTTYTPFAVEAGHPDSLKSHRPPATNGDVGKIIYIKKHHKYHNDLAIIQTNKGKYIIAFEGIEKFKQKEDDILSYEKYNTFIKKDDIVLISHPGAFYQNYENFALKHGFTEAYFKSGDEANDQRPKLQIGDTGKVLFTSPHLDYKERLLAIIEVNGYQYIIGTHALINKKMILKNCLPSKAYYTLDISDKFEELLI